MDKLPCDVGLHYDCKLLNCQCPCHPRPGRRPIELLLTMTGGAATWHPSDDELWAL